MSTAMPTQPPPPRPYGARLLRVVVDVIVITASYVVGVSIDYLFRRDKDPVADSLGGTIDRYWPALLPLLILSIGFFSLSGFYSRQRTYRGRHKAEAVIQATVLTFLTYGALAYSLRAYLLFPPALAIAIAGVTATVVLLALRMYGFVFKRFAQQIADAADPESVERVAVREHDEVLVIGGGGYIGSALVPILLEQGHTVRLLDRFLFGREPITAFADHPHLVIQEADYRRTDQLVIAMRRADSVIHLGGIVGDPACALDESLTTELNLAANRAVAEIARAHGVRRFVFASSCSVYGANDETLDESSSLNPVSLYARTKIASEVVLHELTQPGFRPTILRLGTVYGLSGRIRFDLVVNLLVAKAVTEGVIPVFGPNQWRPFVHVRDAAAAFALCVDTTSAAVEANTFNVGSNDANMTLGQLGRLIATHIHGARVTETPADGDARNYRVNFDRIARELGFAPTRSVADGIDEVAAAFRDGRIPDYRRPEFSNEAWLRELIDLDQLQTDGRSVLRTLDLEVSLVDDPEAFRSARVTSAEGA